MSNTWFMHGAGEPSQVLMNNDGSSPNRHRAASRGCHVFPREEGAEDGAKV